MEIIKTNRIILRKSQNSDIAQILSILNNQDVKQYTPGLYLEKTEDIIVFLNNIKKDSLNEFFFVIEDISSKKIVGIIHSYLSIEYDACTSYVTKAEERGKGYMTEAVKAFILYLYNKKISPSAYFYINVENEASIRVMEKLKIPLVFASNGYIHYSLSLLEKPSF